MKSHLPQSLVALSLAALAWAALASAADKPNDKKKPSAADIKALSAFKEFVGGWRGAGLPKRGSAEGAWQEDSDWAWQFDDGHAALVFEAPESKVYRAGRIETTDKPGVFRFFGTPPEGKPPETFVGRVDEDGKVAFKNDSAADNRPALIEIHTVAQGDRLLVLYQRKSGESSYARIAQVGYTRKGSGFGQGGKANECIVTGGEGDITVTYKDQKYHVCCKGCRDLFNDDPEGVLAEYRIRKKKEQEERKKRDSE